MSLAWQLKLSLSHLVYGYVTELDLTGIIRSVLLYVCERWSLGQGVHHLGVFDHRYLRQLTKVGWSDSKQSGSV